MANLDSPRKAGIRAAIRMSRNQGENQTMPADKRIKVMNCWAIEASIASMPRRLVVWRRARSILS